MSHSSMLPGATDPLSLLQQRLLQAEEEAEALIQDMGALGVSRDQVLGPAQRADPTQPPVNPLKMLRVRGVEGTPWQHKDSLVTWMCRMESLLQTLKLTVFRLETERRLDPSHTARLKQQLETLQQETEEEHQASRREVKQLRDQLHQAHQERDSARAELRRLGEAVEVATAAKVDVALAAEELKMVKSEMSQRLMEMKEQMRQESSRSAAAMRSHGELLQRFEELESVLETERRQALLLRSDCQVLHVQVETSRRQLEEERERGRQLEEHCQLLGEQTAMKDSLVSELKRDLKRRQTENSKLQLEGRELRAAADRVQAERSRAVKKLQEEEKLLEAARRSVHTELQGALTDRASLQLELEKLKGEQAQILQSSSIAQETAATQREVLERTIERLRGELDTARKHEEAVRKDLEGSKNELCLVVTKLESERSSLQTQLSQAKLEAGSLSSALQGQQEENRRLMGKMATLEHHQTRELQALQGVCGPVGAAVSQTPENSKLQLNSPTLQQEPGGREQELVSLRKDRLQAQREIRKHQAEVEKLQRLLTCAHSKNSRDLESLQKASDRAKADNKRLAQSLEQAVLTNSSLHSKLDQTRDQYQAAITLRDEDLREARTKILHLSEELKSRTDYESSMKTLQRDVSELKRTVKDPSAGSCDLPRANQELRLRVSALERLVSKQKARLREQRSELRELHHTAETFEERIRNLHEKEPADSEHQEVRMDSQQVLHKRDADLERWTSTIRRWESRRELAHIAGRAGPVRTQLTTQSQ